MLLNVPGMTELCELEMVGKGIFWEILKAAGYRSVADMRAVGEDGHAGLHAKYSNID